MRIHNISRLSLLYCWVLLFVLGGCTGRGDGLPSNVPTSESTRPPASATPTASPRVDAGQQPPPVSASPVASAASLTPPEIVSTILNEFGFSRGDNGDLFIAEVSAKAGRQASPLDLTKVAVVRCWHSVAGQPLPCTPQEYTRLYQDDNSRSGPWQHSYGVFAFLSLNDSGPLATVRLDNLSGPLAGSGWEYDLRKAGNQWEVRSKRMVWIS